MTIKNEVDDGWVDAILEWGDCSAGGSSDWITIVAGAVASVITKTMIISDDEGA